MELPCRAQQRDHAFKAVKQKGFRYLNAARGVEPAGDLDGLALAIGLHLMMEEVVPTKCWNAIDAAKH